MVSRLRALRDELRESARAPEVLAATERLDQALVRLEMFATAPGVTWDHLVPVRLDMDRTLQDLGWALQLNASQAAIRLSGTWDLLNILAALAIVLAGATLFLMQVALSRGHRLQAAMELLKRMATRDELTGLWNRRAIFPIRARELSRCERERRPLSVLMVDFDHFKKINDQFGHTAGDVVLREGAQRMLRVLRPYDAVGRYGGEEIIILLPGCDAPELRTIGERMAETIRSTPFVMGEHRILATVSIGGATKRSPTREHAERLVISADQYLYEAKNTGRDRVVTGPSLSYSSEISETGC